MGSILYVEDSFVPASVAAMPVTYMAQLSMPILPAWSLLILRFATAFVLAALRSGIIQER